MRKTFILFLCMLMILPLTGALTQTAPATRALVPGERYHILSDFKGGWVSDAPEIASVDEKGWVTALEEGSALILQTVKGKDLPGFEIIVQTDPKVPEMIENAIGIALKEWQDAKGTGFSRSNKYTTWYYGPKASFGWCGAFTSYSLSQAGVPMEKTDAWREAVPLPDGQPHGAREAGVPKLLTAFTNMDRVTNIPRPGYLVIYGNRGGYKTMHVGLVTSVKNRGEGVYLLETVEGNLGSRIKRLSYLYDSKTSDPKRNMAMLLEDERTDPDVFQYQLNHDDWRVTAFAQTWY